jgi:hypothetical protein
MVKRFVSKMCSCTEDLQPHTESKIGRNRTIYIVRYLYTDITIHADESIVRQVAYSSTRREVAVHRHAARTEDIGPVLLPHDHIQMHKVHHHAVDIADTETMRNVPVVDILTAHGLTLDSFQQFIVNDVSSMTLQFKPIQSHPKLTKANHG